MSQLSQVETRLRDMILSLELGPGERLTERAIEAQFGASRTPVRSALLRLEGEGLVRRDGRGFIVAPIDLGELQQLFVYRAAVEVAAVRLSCARIAAGDGSGGVAFVEALQSSCDASTPREVWHRVGMDFHIELARLSGNDFLFASVRNAMVRLSRARWLEVRDDTALKRAWVDHFAILKAVRAGDANEAAGVLAAHVDAGRDRLLTSLRADRRGLRARGFAVAPA